jgi:hypothetical protein
VLFQTIPVMHGSKRPDGKCLVHYGVTQDRKSTIIENECHSSSI